MSDPINFVSALSRPDLLADSVRDVLVRWAEASWFADVQVAEIDPAFAGGLELCAHYGLDQDSGGNCLVIQAKRGADLTTAACLIPPGTRADLNGVVRRHLKARQVTMLDREHAIAESKMEYGSITVVGLPIDWPVLIDSSLSDLPQLVIGSGRLRGKLRLPGKALTAMTGATVLTDLVRS